MRFRHRHGQCKEEPCMNDNGDIPLTYLPEGAKATVTHTLGGMVVVRRLSEMGLTPGCEIQLKRKCSFRGPLEIEVRGVLLALGYGLASHILVQPLKEP